MSSGCATMHRARLMRRSSGPLKSLRAGTICCARALFLARLVEQLASSREGFGRDPSAHHPGQLRRALIVGIQLTHGNDVAAVGAGRSLHQQMMVGARCDLSQVRYHHDLALGAYELDADTNLDRGLAADAGVDLVEDERWQPVRVSTDRLDGEHQPREL